MADLTDPATPRAADHWLPLVYDELRSLAGRYLRREAPGHTLQATALVHEAYLRLAQQGRAEWHERPHFFRVAAQMMRRVLVDHLRAKGARKRSAGTLRVTLAEDVASVEPTSVDVLALDAVLARLEVFDPRQAQVVELRFFAGLSVEETAEVLGISTPTVKREWAVARSYLYEQLAATPPGPHDGP